jgi:hypothetical protein
MCLLEGGGDGLVVDMTAINKQSKGKIPSACTTH